MTTYVVRGGSDLGGVQWAAGADALKISKARLAGALDLIVVPLPKANRMIHASLCVLVLLLSSRAFAQDPNSLCCPGLAAPSPNAINMALVPKFNLDARQECPAGTAMRAISFSHKKDENL